MASFTPRGAVLVSVLALLSCADEPTPVPERGPQTTGSVATAVPLAGKPTAELVKRPEVAALVDVLAAEKRVESSHIGAAGAPSRVYAKYRALVTTANAEEIVALLGHQSPVVRTYMARHVASELSAQVRALVPLANDATAVEVMEGCVVHTDSVGAATREALCWSTLPEAGQALVAIHGAGGPQAAAALACAAPTAPAHAAEAAVKALGAGGLQPDAEAAYLNVLAVATNVKEGCPLARARATHGDAGIQIASARALWRCNDDASLAALNALAAGKNKVVAWNAKASIFLLDPAQRAGLASDRDVMRAVGDRLEPLLRSAEGSEASIALIEALVMAHPAELSRVLSRAVVVPATTAAARRIAAKLEPMKNQPDGFARGAVIDYLARARDADSLHEFHRSLESEAPYELLAALRGIEALRDKTARSAVEKLTQHKDKQVAEAAQKTLAVLTSP
jgi:hypothetical protein